MKDKMNKSDTCLIRKRHVIEKTEVTLIKTISSRTKERIANRVSFNIVRIMWYNTILLLTREFYNNQQNK